MIGRREEGVEMSTAVYYNKIDFYSLEVIIGLFRSRKNVFFSRISVSNCVVF